MKRLTNYQELGQILQDMETQSMHSITWRIFNESRVNRFKETNKDIIEDFFSKAKEIVEKFAQPDEKGQPIVVSVQGVPQLSFLIPEMKTAYTEAQIELWKTSCTIDI